MFQQDSFQHDAFQIEAPPIVGFKSVFPIAGFGLIGQTAGGGTTYNLSGTATSTSTTSDTSSAVVTRSLSGTAASTSSTPDTVALNTANTISFSGTATSTSTTPNTSSLVVTRALGGTASSTSTTPNTVTLTRTVALSGTAASTSVTTASGGAVINTSTHVSVGIGYTDVSPKQVVRTSDNIVYTLLVNCDSYPGDGTSNKIMAYKANQAGIPTSFSEQDSANRPSGGIAQWGIGIDSSNLIHVIYNTRASAGGNITDTRYVTFNTATDTWGSSVSLDNTVNFSEGGGNQGMESVAIAIDANDKPHVVYLATDGTRRRMKYTNKTSGSWAASTTVDDQSFATNEQIWHPNLCFDTTGRILTTFHIGTFNDTADGRVYVRTRETNGTWNTTVAVSGANTALTTIDNSGSLLVTPDNRYHLTFINASTTPANKYIRYYYSDDNGSTWSSNHPGGGTQATHNPGLGMGANGNIRIVAHGTPDVSNVGVNLYYFEGAGGSASWGSWTLWRTDLHVECSVNQRWSQYHYTNTQYLDYVYWDDRYPNDAYYGVDELAAGVNLVITRALSGTATNTSTTPNTASAVITRSLSGTAASTSSTPNTVTLNTQTTYNLSGTAASTSSTSDTASAVITRSLTGTAASTSTTPDTVTLNTTVVVNFSGTAGSTSTTSDTISMVVTRGLSGSSASATLTTDGVGLVITRSFSGTGASTSTTPDTSSAVVTRPLSGNAVSTSLCPDAVSTVITRTLTGLLASTSVTNDVLVLLTGNEATATGTIVIVATAHVPRLVIAGNSPLVSVVGRLPRIRFTAN